MNVNEAYEKILTAPERRVRSAKTTFFAVFYEHDEREVRIMHLTDRRKETLTRDMQNPHGPVRTSFVGIYNCFLDLEEFQEDVEFVRNGNE